MSAVPQPYNPETSFSNEALQPIVVRGLPGSALDAEFENIQTTLNGLRSRLSEIQRDDGELKNGVVGLLSLASEVMQVLGDGNLNPRGAWEAATEYLAGDVFGIGEQTRLVQSDYTSGATYGSTDEDNTSVLGSPPEVGYVTRDTFNGDGIEDTFELSVVPVYENNINVYVDGLYMLGGTDWTISGTLLTFTTPPPLGTDNIVAEVGQVSSVETMSIPDGTITTAKLANLLITTAKIADAAVTAAKIASDAVTTAKIADGAITAAKIVDGAMDASKLANEAVTEAKIAPAAVSSAAIAAGAVNSSKIAAGAVIEASIADSAVTTAKVADAALTAAKLNGAQAGTAPIFGARAFAAFDGISTASQLTGTYSQSGTAVTVNITAHGFRVGDIFYHLPTSGTATAENVIVATVPNANQLTFVSVYTATTSGNVTVPRWTVSGSGNVSSVTGQGGGYYFINFTTALPNANYSLCATTISYSLTGAVESVSLRGNAINWAGPPLYKTSAGVGIICANASAGTPAGMQYVSVVIFG